MHLGLASRLLARFDGRHEGDDSFAVDWQRFDFGCSPQAGGPM